ncbi:hypothetical protein ACH5RR_018173 [Cinchona calisaya]|uniref:Uncharacterized protein n=1 Tax=Cinchona calisaya TaxID=153742 RepID=A0ABD2ZLL1_9GENT
MNFDAKKAYNKKLTGARYFIDSFLAEYGQPLNTFENGDLLSPRDVIGHGTHTASTAASSIALNVSYRALGFGTFQGSAPCARLVVVCAAGMYLPLESSLPPLEDNGGRMGRCSNSKLAFFQQRVIRKHIYCERIQSEFLSCPVNWKQSATARS